MTLVMKMMDVDVDLDLRLDPLQSLPGVFRRPLRRVRAWVDAAAVPGPTLVAPYWIEVH